MKISRSLTDLQNSLDEACRLGLPPNFDTSIYANDDDFPRDYNFRSETTQKTSTPLPGKFKTDHGRSLAQTLATQFVSRNDDRGSNNSANVGSRREVYLNTLRSLVDEGKSENMRRSRSQDILNNAGRRSGVDEVAREKEMMLVKEVRMLRQRLVDMDDEMTRMKSMAEAKEFQSDECNCEELRRKVDIYRGREADLLAQLNDAVATIEEAKYEEMQAVMEADKVKEELENMEKRFKQYVDENVRKCGFDVEDVGEKKVQMVLLRAKEEAEFARTNLGDKVAECTRLKEQLKNANNEIERLNICVRSVENEKRSIETSLDSTVARMKMERDETLAHNRRLQKSLEKESSERKSDKSILEDEVNNLRHRLTTVEQSQVNGVQEKMELMKERDEMRCEMAKLRQSIMTEKAREQEERRKKEEEEKERLERVQATMDRREAYLQDVIQEAEVVMTRQNIVIEKMRKELSLNVEELDGFRERNFEEREELYWRLARTTEEVDATRSRLKEMEDMVEEEGRTLATMRSKYQELEAVKEKQDQEIISLLTGHNGLMKRLEILHMHLREFRRRVSDCSCGLFDDGEQLINEKILDNIMSAV